ncbi:MAG: oligosaccharide flippase family protein [Clostridiales bacterium]|nr:oligosaccharide flippase family protein [Clostridiales bacterium]
MNSKKLLKNTVLMTMFSVFMRMIGLSFQVFISNSIGAEGIGLFQLVMSVNSLAITVATSGVRFAVTRLVAEVIGERKQRDVRSVVNCCFLYAALFGVLAFVLVFFNAEYLARYWAGDIRTAMPIKILSFGLIFISLTTVTGGYFTAVGRVGRAAIIQLVEQLMMISFTFYALPRAAGDMVSGCTAISRSSVCADMFTFIISMSVYFADVRRYGKSSGSKKYFSRLVSISLPLAASAYARTVLNTLQHMLTPAGLRKSGASAEDALASYGAVHGMALPVVLFPSALFTSLAELLIPELTEHQVSGNTVMVNKTVNRILKLCLSFSICCAAVLFTFGEDIGLTLYNDVSVGYYVKLLSPLVIIMYMDTVTDGMLKGLGQQLYTMGVNIADAALSLAMVFFLLPIYAVKAYIFMIFFTECFNFALSILRLTRMADIHINISDILLPLLCSLVSVNLSLLLLNVTGCGGTKLGLAVAICLSALLCVFLLRIFYALSPGKSVIRM